MMDVEMVESAVRGILSKYQTVTPETIRDLIGQMTAIPGSTVTETEAEELARRLESSLDVTMSPGHMVSEPFEEWLPAARAAGMSTYYWGRYRQYLATERKLPNLVISALDQSTDKILRVLENPEKEGDWDRRGMVVGHVQSGKTANYTGLLCKAADAGYKLVVVIAGVHNNLRDQTQQRIDEGFVGRDTARLQTRAEDRYVGVGRLDSTHIPVTVTTRLADFNKSTAERFAVQLKQLRDPAVMVIKKNPSTLKSVLMWLREHNAAGDSLIGDAPMLLIDDEADNASIDVSNSPEEVSRINGQIRELLSLFRRSCYVGYTATPFANIFIDPESPKSMEKEDLFPRDFIIGLDPASNYFGPSRVFGQASELDVLKHIKDNEDVLPLKHRKDDVIPDLPGSLKDAVRTFVLARSIRIARGYSTDHNSMLVNVSRFNNTQSQVRDLLHEFLDKVRNRIRFEADRSGWDADADAELQALYRVWEREYVSAGTSWSDVRSCLRQSVEPIEVVTVNSKSSGSLDYLANSKHGLNVIAVGGFSLSRGLTLEGLTVSYFLRNSMMYDTLLQMGRWFGFRPEYEDLCRIWMRPEAIDWYEHITESIEELREELRDMERNGQTPREFGLKVRSHPDTLLVTARNKMGTGRKVPVEISLSDRLVETSSLEPRFEPQEINRNLAEQLIGRLNAEKPPTTDVEKGNRAWWHVGPDAVVDFVEAFRNHPSCMRTEGSLVGGYIRARMSDELSDWDVVLVGNQRAGRPEDTIVLGGVEVNCQRRSGDFHDSLGALRVSGEKARVASRGIERIGVGQRARELAEARYRESDEYRNRKSGAKSGEPNFPDRIYRHVRERPLLMVHPLALQIGDEGSAPRTPVIAWGISFPPSEYEGQTVEYLVNTTYWRQVFAEALDEDESDGPI